MPTSMTKTLTPESYVHLAKEITIGTVSLDDVSDNVRREVAGLDSRIGVLVESAGAGGNCPTGILELTAIRKTFRAFGLSEGRSSDDFAPGDRIRSVRDKSRFGLVEYVSTARKVIGVSWDGPTDTVVEVDPELVIRMSESVDDVLAMNPGATVCLSEYGAVESPTMKLVPSNPVMSPIVAGKMAEITIHESASGRFYSAKVTSEDGISFSIPMVPGEIEIDNASAMRRESTDMIGLMESVSSKLVAQPTASDDELKKASFDEMLCCDGNADDVFKLAESILNDTRFPSDMESIIEDATKRFNDETGRMPVVSGMAEKSKRAGLIFTGVVSVTEKSSPCKRSVIQDVKASPSNDYSADIDALQSLLVTVDSTIVSAREAMNSTSTGNVSRNLAGSLFDMYSNVICHHDEPWSPISEDTSDKNMFMISESFSEDVIEAASDQGISLISPGQRLMVKLGSPVQAYRAGSQSDAKINKDSVASLYEMLVDCRQSINRLIQQPSNAQLNKKAGRSFLSILALTASRHGYEPWSTIQANGV